MSDSRVPFPWEREHECFPYVAMVMDPDQEHVTTVRQRTVTPRWKDRFIFHVGNTQQVVRFESYHWGASAAEIAREGDVLEAAAKKDMKQAAEKRTGSAASVVVGVAAFGGEAGPVAVGNRGTSVAFEGAEKRELRRVLEGEGRSARSEEEPDQDGWGWGEHPGQYLGYAEFQVSPSLPSFSRFPVQAGDIPAEFQVSACLVLPGNDIASVGVGLTAAQRARKSKP